MITKPKKEGVGAEEEGGGRGNHKIGLPCQNGKNIYPPHSVTLSAMRKLLEFNDLCCQAMQ